ncbi:MAG TPA: beta-propeller fold lactonase family protein [Longimicrobiaceae bacterium]|nr:beta-propeller fold lactonase family protein [Longimicrobiaceae bacterium]
MRIRLALAAMAALAAAGCSGDAGTLAPDTASLAKGKSSPGAVYVTSNSPAGNAVLAFDRSADGTLSPAGSFPTGGTGTGAGLGSQGALVLSDNGQWLLAVNAGSDQVSVFRVRPDGLELTDTEASGGDMPISVTVQGRLVYVLNAGGAGNISGLTLSPHGELAPLPGSTRPLSAAGVGPAQVEFSPDGDVLVVTEKMTDRIVTYAVGGDGLAGPPIPHASAGTTPFGFAFSGRDRLIVSEAFGGAPDASATSSYILGGGGSPTTVSPSVPTTETAACWVAVSRDGRFAYVTNTGSGSVSGYAVARDGTLTLLDADGVTAMTGPGSMPIDEDFSRDGRFLYVLGAGSHAVHAFAFAADGSLAPVDRDPGLPAGSVGLAAR